MFNKIILAGNLTRDIELIYSQGGMGIAKTAIATSRKFTSNGEKKEEVCFVDITFFGKSAEVANNYLRRGSKILVEGRLNFEQWQDKDGNKRSKHSVIVETMKMLDSKSDNQSNNGQTNNDAQQGNANNQSNNSQANQRPQPTYEYQNAQGQPQQQARQAEPQSNMQEINLDEDEIPF